MKIKSLKLTDFKGFEALGLIFGYLRDWRTRVDSSMINNNSIKQIAHFSTKIDIGSKVIEPFINMTERGLYTEHGKDEKQIFKKETNNIKENTGKTYSIIIYPPSRIINDFSC